MLCRKFFYQPMNIENEALMGLNPGRLTAGTQRWMSGRWFFLFNLMIFRFHDECRGLALLKMTFGYCQLATQKCHFFGGFLNGWVSNKSVPTLKKWWLEDDPFPWTGDSMFNFASTPEIEHGSATLCFEFHVKFRGLYPNKTGPY